MRAGRLPFVVHAAPDHAAEGTEIARCRYAEEAAAVVALRGDGATVRTARGRVLFEEGIEEVRASESYDEAAAIMIRRFNRGR